MAQDALQTFIQAVRSAWGPLTTELATTCRDQLALLAQASPLEPWLAQIHAEAPGSQELYRDPDHGFVLLAHVEHQGLFRPPHDHGRAWVVYAVQDGESEMRTYARVQDADGRVRLVRRDTRAVGPGQAQLYLPGDIHDTRCLTASAVLFRFAERDLRAEDREHHQVTRYIERDGVWTTGPA